jgi:predicted membrane protein
MRKRVNIMPVIVIFLIAIFVLGFGATVLPIAWALVFFLVILIAACVVLARSMMRR